MTNKLIVRYGPNAKQPGKYYWCIGSAFGEREEILARIDFESEDDALEDLLDFKKHLAEADIIKIG